MSIIQDLQEKGSASYFSGEYFNRYKGTEYSLRVVVWRGEEYVAGWTTSYPDACPSDGSRGYILYPMAKAVGEFAEHRERQRQWKFSNQGRDILFGPRWSILDKAEGGEEARRRYREAMAEVRVSDLQRSPELQAKTLAQYAKENDFTHLFSVWTSSNQVGPGYLESLLKLDNLLTAAGIEHPPLCPERMPQEFLSLGQDAVRARLDFRRMQGNTSQQYWEEIFQNRWKSLEYAAEREARKEVK